MQNRNRMIRRFFFVLVLLTPYLAFPAQRIAHLTFVDSPNSTIEAKDVSLKLGNHEVEVQELTYVDTGQRDSDLFSHPAGRRLYLFLVDMIFSSPQELLQAKTTIESFLPRIGEGDLVSMAIVTTDDGLKFLCSPTMDRKKILLSLNTLGNKKVSGMIQGADGNLYPEDFPPTSDLFNAISDEDFLNQVKGYQIKEKDRKEARPILLQGMVDLGYALSVLEGRKNILFFTPGLDAGGLSVVLPLREKPVRAGASQSSSADPDTIESITDVTLQRERARSGMDAPVRPRKRSSTDILPDFFAGSDSHIFLIHSGLKIHDIEKKLIERTNGEILEAGTDATSFLDRILASDQTYYVLTCSVEENDLIDLNSVEVEVQGRKVKGQMRWLIPKKPYDYTSLDKMVKVAEAIYKETEPPPEMFRFWADFIPDKGFTKISSFLEMEGPPLIQSDLSSMNFEFFTFVESESVVQDSAYLSFSLDLKNRSLKEKLRKSGVKIWNVLLSHEQPFVIRWVILDTTANKVYSHSIEVPQLEDHFAMTTPFFPSTNLNWIIWPNPLENQSRRGIETSYPYKAGTNLYFFPDLSPRLKASAAGQVLYLRIYGFDGRAETPTLAVTLRDKAGQVSEIPVLGLLQKPGQLSSGGLELFWRLSTIPKIDPGAYQMTVTARDSSAEKESMRELPLEVIAGS